MRAADLTKRALRPHRINALLRLVHNQEIEFQLTDPAQLVVLPAEVYRAFQPLQRLERHHPDILHRGQ